MSDDRTLGRIEANVDALLRGASARDVELAAIRKELIELAARVGAVEKSVAAVIEPVAEFQRIKARWGYITATVVFIFAAIWTVFGAPISAGIRHMLGLKE